MSGVGMPPYRRKGISNAVVIAVAMTILLVGFLSYAYMGRIGAEYLGKALPEKLRQEGERGSELIRIYIWSRNHTLEGEPVITILNVWGKDSEIDVFMVANRTGHVVNVVALGPPMKVPASTAVELSPSALGLAYRTFGELIEYVGGVLAHTVLGNAFGSTWGAPREDYVFGTIITTAVTNITTTVWEIPSVSVQTETNITDVTTLTYPEDWGGDALVIAYDHFESGAPGCEFGCKTDAVMGWRCDRRVSIVGEEKPKVPDYWDSVCGPGAENAPRFSWYLALNPLKIERYWAQYASGAKQWECNEAWLLKNVSLSVVASPTPVIYTAVYTIATSTVRRVYTVTPYTFQTLVSPTGYLTTVTTTIYPPPRWTTMTVSPIVELEALSAWITTRITTAVTGTTVVLHNVFPATIVTTEYRTFPGSTTITRQVYFQSRASYTVTLVIIRTATTSTGTTTIGTSATYTGKPLTATFTYEIVVGREVTYRRAGILTTTFNTEGLDSYQGGHTTGTYGPAPHLYFKLAYPVYIIHRYYERVYCSCQTYQSVEESGKEPPPPPPPNINATRIICDIRVENTETQTTETLPDGSTKVSTYYPIKAIYVNCRPYTPEKK